MRRALVQKARVPRGQAVPNARKAGDGAQPLSAHPSLSTIFSFFRCYPRLSARNSQNPERSAGWRGRALLTAMPGEHRAPFWGRGQDFGVHPEKGRAEALSVPQPLQ